MSENTNPHSYAEIKNGYIVFGLEGTNHANDLTVFYSIAARHDFAVSLNQIDINVDGTTTSDFDYWEAFIYNTPSGGYCNISLVNNDIHTNGTGISDDDLNLAVAHQAAGGTSRVSISNSFYEMNTDTFPTVGGGSVSSNGDVYFTLQNNFGSTKTSGTMILPIHSSAPSNPVEGEIYYNDTDETTYVYDSNSWNALY